ncbi:MAG TPA: hypothetical protein VFG10_05410 [Saprospiraceae bacterium]|nr:hypothetical protein [Saprospiraceae bacterium]
MNIDTEFSILSDFILDNVSVLLKNIGEFHPFGVIIFQNKNPQVIISDDISTDNAQKIKESQEYIIQRLNKLEITSGAVTYLVRYNEKDAVMLKIINLFSNGWVDLVLQYQFLDGEIIYEEFISI